MTTPDPVGVAVAERDHAELLLAEHAAKCRTGDCPDCRSLADHAWRTQRQVDLLGGHAETGEMF